MESLGLAKGSPCKLSSDQAISEHLRGKQKLYLHTNKNPALVKLTLAYHDRFIPSQLI